MKIYLRGINFDAVFVARRERARLCSDGGGFCWAESFLQFCALFPFGRK